MKSFVVIGNDSYIDPNVSKVLSDFRNNLFIYDKLPNAILIFTYIPLFLIALTSNILVILVVSRYRCLRSVTNYFLVNLSIADLLVTLICMPMAVGQAVHSLWLYGDLMCKLTHYLQGVAVSSSVFTITAMSIDRYMAIRHPMSRKIINRRTTRKVIGVLWIMALLIFAPILFIRKFDGFKLDDHEFFYCVESWPDTLTRRSFGIFCFIIVYAIPGLVVVVAYSLMGLRLCSRQLLPEYQMTHGPPGSRNDLFNCDSVNSSWQVSSAGGRLIRERRRVAKILLVLALVFAFCWLPYSVLSLILDLKSKSENESEGSAMASEMLPFAILLGHVNSAVNRLLYCLLSKNFRRSVTELIRHPTRAVRGRQHCKIRMTFRRDPPPSADANSSKDHVSAQSRPRNHHAPDPPKIPMLPCNGLDTEQGEIITGPDNNLALVAYSPSSSGYSSLRQSTDTLAYSQIKDGNGHGILHGSHTHQYHYFPSHPNSKGHCVTFAHPPKFQSPSQSIMTILKRGFPVDTRRVQVPSTIKEESDSYQSNRSRSNVSIRAYVTQ